MPQGYDINTTLRNFRGAIEEKIRVGMYDQFGDRKELMERNSYIFSNIRANLVRKAKSRKSDVEQNLKFTMKDLEEVAHEAGNSVKAVLSRAYIGEAKKAGLK